MKYEKKNLMLPEYDGKFGRLKIIAPAENIISKNGKKSSVAWLTECSCEKKTRKPVKADYLLNGDTTSCGCWNDEQRSARASKMYSKVIVYEDPKIGSAHRIWEASKL